MSIIKPFIEQFQRCPKCNDILYLEAAQRNETSFNHKFNVEIKNDRLTINTRSSYFVNPSQDIFEFSISIINGQIIYCDQTNQFISLYDLDFILSKDCKQCPKIAPPETFHQSINIFYDRADSRFSARPWLEFWTLFAVLGENKIEIIKRNELICLVAINDLPIDDRN